MEKDYLVELSGQVINGIMSSDDSVWSKLFDRGDRAQVADTAVDIALRMLDKINENCVG